MPGWIKIMSSGMIMSYSVMAALTLMLFELSTMVLEILPFRATFPVCYCLQYVIVSSMLLFPVLFEDTFVLFSVS